MRTFDIIAYVVAIAALVIAAWISPLVQRLFAVALIAFILIPFITLVRQ